MIGGDLFHRFFIRFLIGLLVSVSLLIVMFHLFQKRIIFSEWQSDLRQEATWLARHTRPEGAEQLAQAWRTMHNTVRLQIYDAEKQLVADSHPGQPGPGPEVLKGDSASPGHLVAVESVRGNYHLVLSRRWVPAFPYGLHLELVLAGLVIVIVVTMLLYPMVRSLSSTFEKMRSVADEVSSGHFGKTVGIERFDELGDLVRSFDEMSQRLAEAEHLNTRLLHDVSHELRSPLGRIRVMAQTIDRHPEEAEECVRGIGEEVELLDRLVGDLLRTARAEGEALTLDAEPFSLRDWLESTASRLERRVEDRRILWNVVLPERDRVTRGDSQRLAQALGNVVENAVRALADRPDPRIDVELRVEEDDWELSVRDNGPGIPEADLPYVFRRFYRVEEHRDRDRGGVGLGLSLVRAIIEAHRGVVEIESVEGEGTVVSMRFPIVDPEESPDHTLS